MIYCNKIDNFCNQNAMNSLFCTSKCPSTEKETLCLDLSVNYKDTSILCILFCLKIFKMQKVKSQVISEWIYWNQFQT